MIALMWADGVSAWREHLAAAGGAAAWAATQRRRELARALHALDFHVARRLRPHATCCAMNPKGSGTTALVDCVAALPDAGGAPRAAQRHLFMYRDVTKVAESFCSIFAAQARAAAAARADGALGRAARALA